MKRYWAIILGVGLIAGAGCKTVPTDSLATLASGITAAKTQSHEAFQAVNDLVADTSLDFAASQPTLRESSFEAGLDEASLQAWNEIFDKLEIFVQHLQFLTAPDIAKQFDAESVNLSSELKRFGQHLQQTGLTKNTPEFNPSLAAGFTELADLVIRYRSQAQARQAIVAMDAELGRIFVGMADSIGTSQTNGIRGTVAAHWTQQLAVKKEAFLGASDHAAKRQIAAEFSDLMKRRAAQDMILLSLRQTLLQLANLSHALAEGQNLSAQSAVSRIQDEIRRTRDLHDQFKQKLQ